jgi:uncharacterized protein YhaN
VEHEDRQEERERELRADADRLEQQGDELEQESERVEEQIDDTRDEWERKRDSSEVPGAPPREHEADDEPPEASIPGQQTA